MNKGLHRILFVLLILGLRISYAQNNSGTNPIDLKDPSVVKKEVVYDPVTNRYVVKEVIGEDSYKPADDKSFSDFWANKSKQSEKQYWKEKSKESSSKNGDFISNLMDKDNSVSLFGSNFVEIKPQGSAELTFGVTSQKTENPLVRVENQRVTNIDFNQKIQLNVQGIIGEKLFLNTNYNTEATFDFENQMKLNYKGSEDEIIKNVELGNVSLPLNSTLIKGSQNLFGVKANMQFGKLKVSTIVTQQKSDSKSINLSGGAQTINKEVKIDQYDDNRHFFLSQYFYENYDNALKNLPVITTEVQITQLEVWITNVGISANNDARNVIAFTDLGEVSPYQGTVNPSINANFPSNNSNDLYEKLINNSNVRSYNNSSGELLGNFGMQDGIHFNKIENARRLSPNEYYFHPQLGFISLNRKMEEDEVLAVAFQYTVARDGSTRKVGEFSTDAKEVKEALYLKMLKSTQVNNTQIPLWNLMMKNVYSLGTSGVDASSLEIDVFYNNPKTNNNINYLPAGGSISENKRWLQYLGVDKVDPQLNPNPDGRYDIVNGVTIRMENGRIYFPSTKPFGKALRTSIGDNSVADNYAFDSLYYIPKWRAVNDFPDKNRFLIKARYQAQSNIINLNSFSIPEGAVSVTAGGRKLQEGTDFRVNYQTGQLTILNESVLNSNTPIKVDVESNSMFASMSKNLFGTHLNYEVNKNFHVGGTLMNLTERPLMQKNQQGIEPTSNTIWGLNTNYTNESPYLTKLVDKLPFISTKEKSKIQFTGEFAQLVPGSPRAIQDATSGEAQSYIDAFEAGQTNINLANRLAWVLASTPQGQTQAGMWPEGQLFNELAYGFNRSKLAWYNIDPIFIANNSNTPEYMRRNPRIQGNHYQRVVQQSELFPNRSLAIGQVTTLLTFDVAYFPQERGPYNFDTTGGTFSKGINPQTGFLNDPTSRWGGIMRAMSNVDFETRNIEFIEFWMMNPFEDDAVSAFGGGTNGGDFYIHLGNISEDILKDGRRSFENGLPLNASGSTDVDQTSWGRVSNRLNFVNAFDNDPDTRAAQDVGLDGLSNADERTFFRSYLNWFGANPPAGISTDPSGDDYQYFRGEEYDNLQSNVIDRYKRFNGLEGNSATQEQTGLDFISTSSILPDIEDINRDNTLSEGESYYQYKISLRPSDLEQSDIGTNYINQIYSTTVNIEGGTTKDITWYQFRIPIRTPDTTVGKITDFQSIRFMRMAFKNWQDPVVLRFATMDLVQSNWRQYRNPLYDQTQAIPDQTGTTFTLGRVNVEEDSKKKPVRYIEPPNIQRQFNLASQNFENEQSLQLRVCDLDGGDARAIFKMESRDLLSYNKIKMDLHASQIGDAIANLNDMNMSVFIRIGTDFDQNYYEYEVPMSFTDPALVSANNNESARQEIWKKINMMEFNYKEAFVGLKITRNERGIPIDQRFKGTDGKNNVYVKGNPTMANVRTIMIGVRNNNPRGQKRCAEFWVNELRLSDFDNNSGWAATSSVNMQLADLGNLSFGGGYSTPGWGSIDQKISDRSRQTIRNFDATGNFQMGKFFPENTNLSVPLYFSYNRIRKDMQYNPLDTDVEMMELDRNSDVRKKLNLITPDVLINRSINFSNVRKNLKPGAKPKIYSIENFDATYAFSEMNQRDVNTELNSIKNFKGALNYNFRPKGGKYEPFIKTPILNSMEQKKLAKMDAEEQMLKDSLNSLRRFDPNSTEIKSINDRLKVLKDEKMEYKRKMSKLKRSPYLQLGREFHVFYLPKNVSVQTDMNRMFSERMIRNVTGDDILIDPVFNKNWFFNRTYRMDYDLTQSLKLDFTAKNQAFIDEPFGRLDSQVKKDSVWNNIKSLGRNTLYTQTSNINYNIPFNKFPLTNFITTSLRYSGKYDWQAAPLSMDTLGNSISNSNTKQVNAQLNMINFYNKFPYLKKISQNNNTPVKDPRALKSGADQDTTKKKDPFTAKDVFDGTLKFMMMVKNLNVTYSENNGTFIPGFTPKSEVLGMNTQNLMAPGWGFVFGSQNDIVGEAIQNNWLSSRDKFINTRVAFTKQNNFNWRASVEPFKKMRIDLEGKRTETFTDSYFYRLDDVNGGWNKFSPISTGQFSISILTISSAFGSREPRERSAAFKEMEKNRLIIAERLAAENIFQSGIDDPSTEFPNGYSSTQEEVLLYSFLSAYTGRDPKKQNLSPFSKFPIPNWRLNYTGMMDYDFIKKYFDSFTVSHAYNSTFNFNGYQNNPNYINGDELNNLGNFQTIWMYQNTTVGIQESFSPLIKFDMRFKNSILGTLEYKQSRTIGLNFSNSAVVEQAMTEVVVGSGYTIRDLILPIKVKGQKLKSDLDIKANVSVRSSSLTMMVVDGDVTTTQGARILNINLNADYRISQKVTARAFYTQTVNNPYVQTSFPNATSTGGLSIRFTL